jgi:hypothetical protein
VRAQRRSRSRPLNEHHPCGGVRAEVGCGVAVAFDGGEHQVVDHVDVGEQPAEGGGVQQVAGQPASGRAEFGGACVGDVRVPPGGSYSRALF